MTRSSSLLYILVNGFSEWPCQDVQYLLLSPESSLQSLMKFMETPCHWKSMSKSSWCSIPSFFAPQKPSNTYNFTTRTTTTTTPRPTTTLGRLFGRCQARGGLRLTQTNLIPYFRPGPDCGILPSVAFGMGLLGRFVTFWWGCSENPTLRNLKLDLWIHLFGCPTHHPPPTTPFKTCEESHPTSAGGVLLFIEPDVLQSPLNSASAKRPCRNTKSEQERIWFFFTGLECEVSGFEDLSKGSGFSSVSICASY